MTLLESQAEIRSRRKLIRDPSGHFVRPDIAAQDRAKLLATTKELYREVYGTGCKVRRHVRHNHKEAVMEPDLLVMG